MAGSKGRYGSCLVAGKTVFGTLNFSEAYPLLNFCANFVVYRCECWSHRTNEIIVVVSHFRRLYALTVLLEDNAQQISHMTGSCCSVRSLGAPKEACGVFFA